MKKASDKFLTRSKIFFILTLSFLAGVFGASFFEVESSIILILIAVAVSIFILNYKNKKSAVIAVAIIFLAVGAWRTSDVRIVSVEKIKNDPLGPAEFSAIVSKESESDERYQKLVISSNESDVGGGKILINADLYPVYDFGDDLKIRCNLQEPENFEESRFDYRMFLAKDGIYRICKKAEIILVAKNRGNKLYSAVLGLKNSFEKKISSSIPDPEGAYLKGLLLGGSKRMTKDLKEAFSKTGSTHAVAVSGYNVTIVAAFLMWLGISVGLWRQQVFSFALTGIVLFVLMTGAPSSAVRAGIMGSLVIWAMKEGRLANSENAILAAGSLMLAVNPLLLRYDAGFQLSFLATLGIVWLYPLFEKYFFGKGQNILKETILMTLAAQFFVLPIILWNFEKISPISPIANLLILPAIPYIMLGGFAAGLAGFVFVPLGKLIGFIPYGLLKLELIAVQWLASFSWSSVEIKNFGWLYIVVYYIVLSALLYFAKRKSRLLPKPAFESRLI